MMTADAQGLTPAVRGLPLGIHRRYRRAAMRAKAAQAGEPFEPELTQEEYAGHDFLWWPDSQPRPTAAERLLTRCRLSPPRTRGRGGGAARPESPLEPKEEPGSTWALTMGPDPFTEGSQADAAPAAESKADGGPAKSHAGSQSPSWQEQKAIAAKVAEATVDGASEEVVAAAVASAIASRDAEGGAEAEGSCREQGGTRVQPDGGDTPTERRADAGDAAAAPAPAPAPVAAPVVVDTSQQAEASRAQAPAEAPAEASAEARAGAPAEAPDAQAGEDEGPAEVVASVVSAALEAVRAMATPN